MLQGLMPANFTAAIIYYKWLLFSTAVTIDIEVSRLAIEFQKVCIIVLPQCFNTTLNFALRVAHLLAA